MLNRLLTANPLYLFFALLVVISSVAALAYLRGHTNASNACAAKQLDSVGTAIKSETKKVEQNLQVEVAHAESQTEVRDTFRQIKTEESQHARDHPELNSCGLDAAGLQHWVDANLGRRSRDPR
ncbi:hypothetical protein [Solemya pervernicosa gill symbiont]|uniref:hypothetical protein n=1 Tax=Solemya pervernicosa gill symbiont TaxID=642797 RepID=UPI00108384F9|nr:hypothetical protein [Solemya pervernicosa gill symbiont]